MQPAPLISAPGACTMAALPHNPEQHTRGPPGATSTVILESLAAAALIFALRCFDISLGTIRMVFAVEGRRFLAAAFGFAEATAFIIGAGIVLSDVTDPIKIVGYSAGYATGTALGVTVARTLRLGMATIRIVSPHGPVGLAQALRDQGYVVNTFDGEGADGPIRLILLNVRKRQVPTVMAVAQPWLEECMITVGDEPVVAGGVFPGIRARV